jgi:hypothetical protein
MFLVASKSTPNAKLAEIKMPYTAEVKNASSEGIQAQQNPAV